jgi:hypothetical protein
MRAAKRVRKAKAFRGRANKTALPFSLHQTTKPLEMFQWNIFNERKAKIPAPKNLLSE